MEVKGQAEAATQSVQPEEKFNYIYVHHMNVKIKQTIQIRLQSKITHKNKTLKFTGSVGRKHADLEPRFPNSNCYCIELWIVFQLGNYKWPPNLFIDGWRNNKKENLKETYFYRCLYATKGMKKVEN